MKFSIVVIGHNQKYRICDAVQSAISQTYKDVEVVYVDDASTDGTLDFIEQECKSDRLQIVRLAENHGPLYARMTGVSHATGQWVLFLDGDDLYDVSACFVLAETIAKAKSDVDLVGFGVKMAYEGSVSDAVRVDVERRIVKPCLGYQSGEQLLDAVYLQEAMSWNICNKCYSIDLLKKVQQSIHLEKLYASEDFYMNFLACHMSKSYYGISDRLYQYTIGVGISTARTSTLVSLRRQLTGVTSVYYTEQYAESHGIAERYRSMFTKLRRDLLYSSYYKLTWLPEADRSAATKDLFNVFGADTVLSGIADGFGGTINESAKYLDLNEVLPFQKRPIRRVGMYYYRMYNGGVERVIQLLTPILQRAGYEVVVMTDEPRTEMDYPLPENTVRVELGDPDAEADKAQAYADRARRIEQCIRDNRLDAVIYHAWLSDRLFFDMCAIKKAGAACLVHCHGVFFSGMNNGWTHCFDAAPVFRHADGIMALSEVDRYHWSAINSNVFRVNNPLTFIPAQIPQAKLETHNIVWVGRFDPVQKNPFDIVQIFGEVCKSVSDAKLYLVGTGDESVVQQMQELARGMNVDDRVIFTGFTNDVSSYLLDASAYLFTSNYEGYSMAYAEALSHGLPVVTYPLPYMTMAKDSEATVHVGWKDIHGAANALVEILTNEKKRLEMGNAARREAAFYGEEDLTVTWKAIFASLEQDAQPAEYVPSSETLAAYRKSVDVALRQVTYSMAAVKADNAELFGVYSSKRYRLGSLLLNIPSKLLQSIKKILKK